MRLIIKVLGSGCPRCHRVEENTREALRVLTAETPDLEVDLEHVTQAGRIMDYEILATPGLVVNEEVVCAGRIPTVNEVLGWLRDTLEDGPQ